MATLTYVYSDSTAVVGPLATVREPHSWDLCLGHASRITAPRGWELVRHNGPFPAQPEDDDLVALADAVREGRERRDRRVAGVPTLPSFSESAGPTSVPPRIGLAPGGPRSASAGRRRGHLRVLPDPAE